VNTKHCRYQVLKDVFASLGFKTSEKSAVDPDAPPHAWGDIFWSDTWLDFDKLRFTRFQRINHFPGMYELSHKVKLARNLGGMAKQFPADFSWAPQTWTMPADLGEFKMVSAKAKKGTTYIFKPDNS
jgi:hypothetical protein